jgi:adenylate cyclase
LAAEDALCHVALGWAFSLKGGTQPAIRAFERAIEVNPSFAWGWWGLATMLSAERPDEALSLTQKALRLSPLDVSAPLVMHVCALCCFNAGRDDEAVKWELQAIEQGGRVAPQMHRLLGAALGHLGRNDEARAAIEEARRLAPDVTLEQLRARNSPALIDRMLEGWTKAGWSPSE